MYLLMVKLSQNIRYEKCLSYVIHSLKIQKFRNQTSLQWPVTNTLSQMRHALHIWVDLLKGDSVAHDRSAHIKHDKNGKHTPHPC